MLINKAAKKEKKEKRAKRELMKINLSGDTVNIFKGRLQFSH